ncbi:hypothetical protein GF318_02065, partial [Candidatus Micrarchaeota archaeon]|nr:hypothetical protein [Candidatus Micrarchaeota archaeon]
FNALSEGPFGPDVSVDPESLSSLLRAATVGELCVGLAHDFKNLLSVVSCGIDGCLQEIDNRREIPESSKQLLLQYLHGMRRASNTAKSLCDNVQSVGLRKTYRTREYVREIVEVSTALFQNALKYDGILENKSATLQNNADPWHNAAMVAPEVQLCILNILINAVQHGGRNPIEITINSKADSNNVFLEIANNGKPVPEEIRDSLLEEPLSSHCNQGYGLFISAMNLREMGGDLGFTSNEEQTVFTLKLPKA